MRKPGEFDCDAEGRRYRREQKTGLAREEFPAAARQPGEKSADRARHVEPRASSTHGLLHARKVKRSGGTLVTNQAGPAIHNGCRRHEPRIPARQRIRSGEERHGPQYRGHGQTCGKEPEHGIDCTADE